MADQKTVWIYIHTDNKLSEGPTLLVFAKKADALAHAADSIKRIASEEIEAFEWSEDAPNPQELREILGDIEQGRHSDAVDGWENYRQEYDHDESVTVQEAPFFE